MKVCIYKGNENLVEKSGVGSAIRHQVTALTDAGCEVVRHMDLDTQVVHVNTVFPDSVLAAILAKMSGKTVIYYGHSTMEDFRYSFKGSNLLAPAFRAWIKFCYNRGDIILTPTEYSRSLLLQYGIRKPVIALSNGIDTRQYVPDREKRKIFREKYQIAEETKVILSVGHYMERKGILEFIEMAEKMPQVQFLWFGYTSPKLIPSVVQKAIEKAPGNIRFPGYVTPEELRYAYQGSDLFCFMSHEETEGIVVLEALACELTVLVRDIPVYEDWLTDGVNAYKADNTDEFVDKAGKILNGELPDISGQGRKVAEERSFSRIADKMKWIYSRYCPEKSGKGVWAWRGGTFRENTNR